MKGVLVKLEDIDLSDIEFWAKPWAERNAAFATLRRENPIAYFPEPIVEPFPQGPGYFAITKMHDLLEISRHPEVFCSGQGAVSILDMPSDMNEFYGSLISMDDPRHARLRKIVSGTFTPRMLNNVLEDVEKTAKRVVDGIVEKGEIDFVKDVSMPFPLLVILDMMGIPHSEFETVLTQSNIILSGGDPDFIPEGTDPITAFLGAGATLAGLLNDLAVLRRANPTDDLLSALVNTEVDGEQLSGDELASFFILLSVAGHETTRTALSHGITHLSQNPDQRALFLADIDGVMPTTVEEIVRYASPVVWMRRTLTQDYVLSGHEFHEGDKIIMYYGSANRDEAVFADPDAFNVLRDPNPHVGFGGPGPHFCLGAHLARREITLMFRELYTRLPDIELAGPPVQLRSNFINGVKSLPVSFTPGGVR
ncbi:MAG: cytochrome P450 [Actinobacteria bacterium]|nr:cytochrome P450 [Actinomycetota bacterium]MSZ14135.1 cytochrome P450 [Actinomycetota bacterium]MTA18309.1 cytochrome P450 [Actinomycetota bacterium]MTA87521.1 cytochrome P450 [Actinomycetota bacterium]